MATQAQLAAVQQLYVGYLGRAADAAGQKFWADAIANGTATIASVATGFTLSAEYKAAYAGLDSAALVDKIYNNVLGRAADAEGKAFWVDALAKGTVAADTLLATMITNLGALDQQTINNKVFVAQTYTDTVGADYNPTAGAEVLAGVTNDPATVQEALDKIASGSLTGQVPGQALINAQVAAEAAVDAYEAANKTGIDALVAKLAATKTPAGADQTTDTDAIVANSTFQDKVDAVVADAAAFRVAVSAEADTSVLVTRAATADAKLKASYAALTATEKANADKYVAAIAAEATAKAGAATATEKGAAIGGLDQDATATTALAAHTDAATLYAEYVAATPAARTAIDTEFKDSAFYATFKAAVAKDAAYADAVKATAAAKDVLDTANGNGSAAGDTYVADLAAKTGADKLVVDAKAADADIAAAKVFADAYKALNDAVTKAGQAITDFNTENTGVSKIIDIASVVVGTDPVKDVFYFADKAATIDAGADFSVAFGSGDSIVLGNGFTFNNGALTAGDNNKAEFFLVQTDTGTQVVIESKAFGSNSVTADAHTGVANAADAVTVITLTGVNVADLTVNNGVISHVA